MDHKADNKTYAAFAGTILIGGTNFIAVSLSNQEMPPLFGAAFRFALAALLLFLITRARGIPLAHGRAAAGAILYGLLTFGVGVALLYYALVGLAAGTVAVIVSTVPLFTLIIAVLLRQEQLSLRRVIAGILVVAGIAILSAGTLSSSLNRSYLIAAILAAIVSALSSIIAKALIDIHPLNLNTIGITTGMVFLAVGSLLVGETWALPHDTKTWLAILWLVVLGSVLLFQFFLYVLRRLTASASVYAIAGMPVIAAGLGAVLLDQPITMPVAAGGALVIIAVYIGAISGMKGGPKIPLPECPDLPTEATAEE
ncbi:MAG TPA: EamA family transporter [Chloroflexota bacterium]|nr:EamA family transporter [Chloroflexota bacterium]